MARASELEKRAIDAVTSFTRIQMREGGFYRRIIPPFQITNDELDRQVNKELDRQVDKPVRISVGSRKSRISRSIEIG